jgi:hypothetical protein
MSEAEALLLSVNPIWLIATGLMLLGWLSAAMRCDTKCSKPARRMNGLLENPTHKAVALGSRLGRPEIQNTHMRHYQVAFGLRLRSIEALPQVETDRADAPAPGQLTTAKQSAVVAR